MSIENLDIVTSIQNYIAELERTANVSGGEAAEYAAEASRSGLESLPGERREKQYRIGMLGFHLDILFHQRSFDNFLGHDIFLLYSYE